MSFFDDVNEVLDTADAEQEKNPYLADPKKGLELIAKLLPDNQKKTSTDKIAGRLDYMLDNEILLTLKDLGKNTLALSRQLTRLSDKIMEYKKVRLLSGKSIVAIVGRFSAGKSGFINSLTTDSRIILPEDQNPTTSIPTYIVGGQKEVIQAYSGGRTINLDMDAMQAMTHRFFEEYKIGFSRFIGNLVIYTPNFPAKQRDRIIFLDTPGYNKADIDTRENMTDEYLAEQQVKAADFLILLVTVDDGIVDKDIDFIQRVAIENPVLVVVNKADRKTESDCRAIVEHGQQILKNRGVKIFGITAYSSHEGKEYFGKNLVAQFLDFAGQNAAGSHDVETELKNLTRSIDKDFDKAIESTGNRQHELGDSVYKAMDILAIKSLVHIYSRVCQKYGRLQGNKKRFKYLAEKIHRDFDDLMHLAEKV